MKNETQHKSRSQQFHSLLIAHFATFIYIYQSFFFNDICRYLTIQSENSMVSGRWYVGLLFSFVKNKFGRNSHPKNEWYFLGRPVFFFPNALPATKIHFHTTQKKSNNQFIPSFSELETGFIFTPTTYHLYYHKKSCV